MNLTITALALALTATPQAVSPTVTATYTASEQAIYDKAFSDGIHEQFCYLNCLSLKDQVEYRKSEMKPKKKSKNPEDNVGDDMIAEELDRVEDKLFGEDRYGSKKAIARKKRFLKSNKCDCSKFKDKREK